MADEPDNPAGEHDNDPSEPTRSIDEPTGPAGAPESARPRHGHRAQPARHDRAQPARESRTTRWQILSWTALGIGVLVLIGLAWTGLRAYQAYTHLADAKTVANDIADQVSSDGLGGLAAITDDVDTLTDATSAAHSATNDLIYRGATHLPWIGGNLAALRDVAVSLDNIAAATQQGLPALTPLTEETDWAHGGSFDMSVVTPAATAIETIDDAVQAANARIAGIDQQHLVGPVNEALDAYRDQLATISRYSHTGATAARIAVPMLGGDGPRDYLVVFQNLAELRARGGLWGFYADLHIENGTLTIGASGSSDRELHGLADPSDGVPPQIEQLYAGDINAYPQDVNVTPDYPTSARVFSEMYTQTTGRSVDGVIAIDPVVASVLMDGMAPIDIGEGLTLSSDTAVDVLLSKIYDAFPGGARLAARDALMRKAVGSAFDAMLHNMTDLDAATMIDDLDGLIGERRILMWAADDDLEATIQTTAVSGRQAVDAVGAPTIGMFFNSKTGAKLDYYTDAHATLSAATCQVDGTADATLTVELESHAPKGLPPYVVGVTNLQQGWPYTLYLNAVFTAPTAGTFGDITIDGKPTPIQRGNDHDRDVSVISFTMTPGTAVTIAVPVTFEAAALPDSDRTVTPQVVTTPLARGLPVDISSFPSCAGN